MKILISGASGFIGGHLYTYLDELGYEVDQIGKNEFMHEDFGILNRFKPDVVVHCAWIRNKDLQITDHLEFAELSCHFFDECRKAGIRVINIGSSSEYGPKLKPMKEDMTCEPVSTYGIAKLMVTLYAKKLGFNTLRLFTVYGKGGTWDLNNLLTKTISKEPQRHFVSVYEVCGAIERLMHAHHLYGEVINVASRENPTANYFMKDGCVFGTYPQRQYEPAMWEADLTKYEELL